MIKFQNVSVEIKGKRILNNINLTVNDGEFVLLCGESGCGKTTLTRLVNGMIPHFIKDVKVDGTVTVNDLDIAESPMYKIAESVGSVFQNPKTQFFNTDSSAEIAFGLENIGADRDYMRKRVAQTISDLEIENLADRNVFSMSGGEKQLLAFASVYAMNPQIYVLDEPSANLDYEAIEKLRKILETVKNGGHTVLIAEHRLSYLYGLADRIVYLKDGCIEKDFTATEFVGITESERIAMGLRSICSEEIDIPERVIMQPDSSLAVHHLSVKRKKQAVIHDFSLSANIGDIIGIVGKNGSGKSTLCSSLCGLLPTVNGEVIFRGRKLSRRARNRHFGVVMQDVNHQLFSDSVKNECLSANPDATDQEIEDLLNSFDLLDCIDRHPLTLSGGQRQRLAICQAIMGKKKFLIFDEPTSGLDFRHMCRVTEWLKQLAQRGYILFVVTHDYEFLNRACNCYIQIERVSESAERKKP
jgi:energy-coupling factor transporter ATP-binding protein EcfA2